MVLLVFLLMNLKPILHYGLEIHRMRNARHNVKSIISHRNQLYPIENIPCSRRFCIGLTCGLGLYKNVTTKHSIIWALLFLLIIVYFSLTICTTYAPPCDKYYTNIQMSITHLLLQVPWGTSAGKQKNGFCF